MSWGSASPRHSFVLTAGRNRARSPERLSYGRSGLTPAKTGVGVRRAFIILFLALSTGVATLAPLAPGGASTPTSGHLSKKSSSLSWTGGTFLVPHPTCVGAEDPLCDHFFLTVDSAKPDLVYVSIVAGDPMFDYVDLEVFGPDGVRIAFSDRRWGYEDVVFRHQVRGPATYEVRVIPVAVRPGVSYAGQARLEKAKKDGGLSPIDNEFGCGSIGRANSQEDILFALSTPDDGRLVKLETLVLVDGVPLERAKEIVAGAVRIYSAINIEMVPRYEAVEFTNEGMMLNQEARYYLGGEKPAGTDVVYTLTNKSMGIAEGYVQCIGGVSSSDGAFAAGVNIPYDNTTAPGTDVHFYENTSSVVMAHEIGHLLGGIHDHGNCVEGDSAKIVTRRTAQPCTVMFPESTGAGQVFSTFEREVIREYAVLYASP